MGRAYFGTTEPLKTLSSRDGTVRYVGQKHGCYLSG